MADRKLVATTEQLDEATCLDLMASEPVGRIGFVVHGEPEVLPVNFAVDAGTVVFRTARGSKLAVAERTPGTVVAFEVDAYDRDDHSGWSVLVKGPIEAVLDTVTQDRLNNLHGILPWTDRREREQWVRIRPTMVTGRRIIVAEVDG